MERFMLKLAIAGLAFSTLSVFTACEPDPGIPVYTVTDDEPAPAAKKYQIDPSILEVADGNWKPVKNWEIQINPRNPFRGFTDSMLAEIAQKQMVTENTIAEELLPEQMYNVRDYSLISVITGTSDPKAYVIDPGGNRFILRRGSLIGNNNGSVSSIRRDGIEVFEMVSGEGVYIDIPLYTTDTESNIKLTLQ